MAYLPPDAAKVGTKLARRVLRRALPGDGRRRRRDAAVRSGERPDPAEAVNILVCVKRVPATGGRIVLTADGQTIDTRFLGFTDQPARGVRASRRPSGSSRRRAARRPS